MCRITELTSEETEFASAGSNCLTRKTLFLTNWVVKIVFRNLLHEENVAGNPYFTHNSPTKPKRAPWRGWPNSLKEMVRPERFELPTFWFVARRSIQLS